MQFMAAWKFHNPLTVDQIPFAGLETTVSEISYYHGGDALYQLADAPGIWHEQCLLTAQ